MRRLTMLLLSMAVFGPWAADTVLARDVNMDVPVDHQASNPCTNNPIHIRGDIGVNGQFQSVEAGYRFTGEVDFSGMEAVGQDGTTYQAVAVGDDTITKTVDFPVDTTLSQDVAFEGPNQELIGDMTARINVGFFSRDVSIESVELMCRNGPLSPSTIGDAP